jgi:hypothetical protein
LPNLSTYESPLKTVYIFPLEKQHILLLPTLYIRTSIENTKEPSPSLLSNENAANRSKKKDDSLVNEDPLKGLVPLGPLGLFSATRQPSHLPSDSRGRGGSAGTPQHGGHTKPTHQLPFSSKIDQFCGNGGGGTTIAANATTLFQPHQGTLYTIFYSSLCDTIDFFKMLVFIDLWYQ